MQIPAEMLEAQNCYINVHLHFQLFDVLLLVIGIELGIVRNVWGGDEGRTAVKAKQFINPAALWNVDNLFIF